MIIIPSNHTQFSFLAIQKIQGDTSSFQTSLKRDSLLKLIVTMGSIILWNKQMLFLKIKKITKPYFRGFKREYILSIEF